MAGKIVRTKNARLGLKLSRRPDKAEASIGYALIERSRPKPQRVEYGDVLALARDAARTWDHRKNGPFTLFTYENDRAFVGSLGAKGGLTRAAHTETVEFIASQLASEGFDVTICEVA